MLLLIVSCLLWFENLSFPFSFVAVEGTDGERFWILLSFSFAFVCVCVCLAIVVFCLVAEKVEVMKGKWCLLNFNVGVLLTFEKWEIWISHFLNFSSHFLYHFIRNQMRNRGFVFFYFCFLFFSATKRWTSMVDFFSVQLSWDGSNQRWSLIFSYLIPLLSCRWAVTVFMDILVILIIG